LGFGDGEWDFDKTVFRSLACSKYQNSNEVRI